MSMTWNEDGVDDSGERMYISSNPQNEEGNSSTNNNNKNSNNNNSSNNSTNVIMFGRQRQVQQLREAHRLKMEAMKSQRPSNGGASSSDDDELNNDGLHSSIVTRFPLAHKNLDLDADDSAFVQMVKQQQRKQQQQQQSSRKGGEDSNDFDEENNEEYLFSSTANSRIGSAVSAATPSPAAIIKHVKFSPNTLEESSTTHHKQAAANSKRQQQQQQYVSPSSLQRASVLNFSDNNNNNTGGGAATSSQVSSTEGAPSLLDIGSEKMPLRFFPDQRTTSGWRGVVRPTGGAFGFSHLKSQIARNHQELEKRAATKNQTNNGHDNNKGEQLASLLSDSSSPPVLSASNVAALVDQQQKRGVKSAAVENFVHSQNSPASLKKGINRMYSKTPQPKVVVGRDEVTLHRLHHHHQLPDIHNHQSKNNTHTSPSALNTLQRSLSRQRNRLSASPSQALANVKSSPTLKKDHLTVFNTFKEPNNVPTSHKYRNANPVQEGIMKALPAPRSDVDVAVIAPRISQFLAGGGSPTSKSMRNRAMATGVGASFMSSSNQNNDVIADVRLVILDDVHHNLHRTVSRQLERSPQQKRKPTTTTNTVGRTSSSTQKKTVVRKSNSGNIAEAALDASLGTTSASASTNNLPSSSKKHFFGETLALQTSSYVDDSSEDELDDNFVSVDDEKVAVGGDVIGGSAKMLPKMRGRWDAMRDAIKERYFAKQAPPVEPIGHALRHLPLPELCSMYRRCVKEIKGAMEMDRRIFAILVKMMMKALPQNPVVTEDDITKYYYIFDMNGNGGISFIEFLTTVVDFQTDAKETNFLRSLFNNFLSASGQQDAVDAEDLSARAPWSLLEDVDSVFDQVLKALRKSPRFPRVVEKTFCDCLAHAMKQARKEAESALCQESYSGLFWEQFRLIVCLDSELMIPLRTIKLKDLSVAQKEEAEK